MSIKCSSCDKETVPVKGRCYFCNEILVENENYNEMINTMVHAGWPGHMVHKAIDRIKEKDQKRKQLDGVFTKIETYEPDQMDTYIKGVGGIQIRSDGGKNTSIKRKNENGDWEDIKYVRGIYIQMTVDKPITVTIERYILPDDPHID